jgi:hypothetical protein
MTRVEEYDIDISGDGLPPGVQEGSLGGTDEPPEGATTVVTSADELDARLVATRTSAPSPTRLRRRASSS